MTAEITDAAELKALAATLKESLPRAAASG
jgi:hypothetical protein